MGNTEEKKRNANELNIENVLEKLQRKTFDVMGPLSKLWNILERAKGAEEDAVQISINDLLHYVEQTVLLLGQSSSKDSNQGFGVTSAKT